MKNTKFTKGNWCVRDNYVGLFNKSFPYSHGMMLNICTLDTWDFGDVWKSNAHLIAAAPEMYKALDDLANGRGLDLPIEKLLAKARGEGQCGN